MLSRALSLFPDFLLPSIVFFSFLGAASGERGAAGFFPETQFPPHLIEKKTNIQDEHPEHHPEDAHRGQEAGRGHHQEAVSSKS